MRRPNLGCPPEAGLRPRGLLTRGTVRVARRLRDRASSFYLFGASRSVANLLALALARWLDPEFVWVEVEGPPAAPGSAGRPPGWVDRAGHHYGARADALVPAPAPTLAVVRDVVADAGPDEATGHLQDFVRLPDIVQELIALEPSAAHPRVLLMTNTDFTEAYFPPVPGAMLPFLRAANLEHVTLVCSRLGGDRANRFDFEYVLRAAPGPGGGWGAGTIEVEKGVAGTPFVPGATVPIGEVAAFDAAAALLGGSPATADGRRGPRGTPPR